MSSKESAAEAEPDFHSGIHVGHVVLQVRCQCMILNQGLSHLLVVFSKSLFLLAASGKECTKGLYSALV